MTLELFEQFFIFCLLETKYIVLVVVAILLLAWILSLKRYIYDLELDIIYLEKHQTSFYDRQKQDMKDFLSIPSSFN